MENKLTDGSVAAVAAAVSAGPVLPVLLVRAGAAFGPGRIVPIGLLIVALLLPFWAGRFAMTVAVMFLFYTYLAASWNIVAGYAGQFSLAHAAFFGIGAYSSSWLYTRHGLSPWFGMVVGIGISGGIAWALGKLSFRYKLAGAYFAIGTLAFSEIVRVLLNSLPYFGQGSGIVMQLEQPGWARLQFDRPDYFYYLFLLLTVAILAFTAWLGKSRFGYRLACVRESEPVAQSLGIDPAREKLSAFVISAALAAPAGSLYGQFLMFVDPPTFLGLALTIAIVLPALVGGAGTVWGPVCGAALLVGSNELFSRLGARPGVSLFAYGLTLMACVLFMPQGIWPTLRQRFGRKETS